MAKQSLTDQMIDGVIETNKKSAIKFKDKTCRVKLCPQCLAIWPNAQKFCNHCAYQFYGNWKD